MPARDYQTAAKREIYAKLREHRSTLLVLPTGCHAPGQGIITYDGEIVEARSVRVGDQLMGPDGSPRDVVRLWTGRTHMVEVIPSTGSPWVVTWDHKMTVYCDVDIPAGMLPSERMGLLDMPLYMLRRDQDLFKLARMGRDLSLGIEETASFTTRDVGRGEYFGWTVAGRDSRYLLDDFTITHNCGKTFVFTDIAADVVSKGKRVLILAHTSELIDQAADKLKQFTGIEAAIEKAERKEGTTPVGDGLFDDGGGKMPMVVVGTWQSMIKRLDRFEPDHFGLVVVDEAHRAVSASYQKLTGHFSGAKVLGVTATPDRGDSVALREAFDSVAFVYEIKGAIEDGWLVPIRQKIVETKHLDLSKCRTVAGDLNQGDLAAVMTEMANLHEVAGPTVKLCEDRQAIVFTATVKHAYMLAEVMREHVRDRARELGRPVPPDSIVAALDGTSPKDERKAVIEAFHRGDVQFLLNCALYTEGFDSPGASAIVMARPTKSRSLYAQMLGRATRALAGTVDGEGKGTPEARRAAISASKKSDMLVLDFAGNAGKHSLVNACDVLDGDASEAVKKIAKGLIEREEVSDILEAMRLAAERVAEMERAKMRKDARTHHRTIAVDPFTVFGVSGGGGRDVWGRMASDRQMEALDSAGIKSEGMNSTQASRIIGAMVDRRSKGLCTYKQGSRLIKSGIDPAAVWTMKFKEASDLISELARNKWKAPKSWASRFEMEEAR